MTEETNQLTDMNSECGSSEPYALQVTDNSMEPEFPKDCIVIVDPSGSCNDGQYIFVEYDGVRWFRRSQSQHFLSYALFDDLQLISESFLPIELLDLLCELGFACH